MPGSLLRRRTAKAFGPRVRTHGKGKQKIEKFTSFGEIYFTDRSFPHLVPQVVRRVEGAIRQRASVSKQAGSLILACNPWLPWRKCPYLTVTSIVPVFFSLSVTVSVAVPALIPFTVIFESFTVAVATVLSLETTEKGILPVRM